MIKLTQSEVLQHQVALTLTPPGADNGAAEPYISPMTSTEQRYFHSYC